MPKPSSKTQTRARSRAAKAAIPVTLTAGLLAGVAPWTSAEAATLSGSFTIQPGQVVTQVGSEEIGNGLVGITHKLPSKAGSNLYLGSVARSDGADTGYRGKVQVKSDGSVVLTPTRAVKGTE